LSQLHQRITSFNTLKPLGMEETGRFIEHRLRVAGCQRESLFSPDAVASIWELSGGIPRNINNLCFHSLSLAFAMKKETVDLAVVQEVAEDLDIHRLLDDHTAAPSRRNSNLRYGLDLDYQKEWDGEPWLTPDRSPVAPVKRNGGGAGKASDTDWRLTLSPDEARDYIQNLTKMLRTGTGESGPRAVAPIRPDKLP
jgi:hypothetical protein